MKIRKILAAVVATAIAVSALATSAFAGATTFTGIATAGVVDEGGIVKIYLLGDGGTIAADNGFSITDVAGFTIYTDTVTEEWLGGALVFASDAAGWTQTNFRTNTDELTDAEVLLADGKCTVQLAASPFAATDTYACLCIQNWGGDFNISKLELLNAAGEVIFTLPAPVADATVGDTDVATDGASKDAADTGVEGVAVIAGLALVATGAIIVAKKRK